MDQLNYYTTNRYELKNRILVDEIQRANEQERQRQEFVMRNKMFHQ